MSHEGDGRTLAAVQAFIAAMTETDAPLCALELPWEPYRMLCEDWCRKWSAEWRQDPPRAIEVEGCLVRGPAWEIRRTRSDAWCDGYAPGTKVMTIPYPFNPTVLEVVGVEIQETWCCPQHPQLRFIRPAAFRVGE